MATTENQLVHSRSIILLGLLMAMCVTFMSAGLVVWRYNQVVEAAEGNIDNVTKLLIAQTEQALKSIDAAQDQIVNRIKLQSSSFSEPFAITARAPAIQAEIKLLVDTVDILDALAVVDSSGDILSSSRGTTTPNFNVSDRIYFSSIKAGGLTDLWDGPLRNRDNGAWTVFHAVRINADDGSLAGVLIALLSVEQIERQFRNISLPPGSMISLMKSDGAVLANYPSASLSPMGPQPDQAVLTAARRIANYPLMITTSSPTQAVLASWKRESATVGLLAVALNCTLALAGFLGLRHLRSSAKALRKEQHAARHDILTALPNRYYFQSHLSDLLSRERHQAFALMLVDLDRFKEVNDALGHAVGDRLLQVVAQRFANAIGPGDFLARLGGDEFAILHPKDADDWRSDELSKRIVQSLASPVAIENAELKISCSVGISETGSGLSSASQLLAQADLALYRAKDAGRNAACIYTSELGLERRRRIELQNDLAAAVDTSGLQVFFQPIVDLEARRVASFEALLRWKCPKRGFVSPAAFIPLAEENGLIGRIGEWVLNEAARNAATWPDGITVAVNLSPGQLLIQDVYETTRSALAASGLANHRLTLEITESVQLHKTMAGQVLSALKALGVRIALDDFGTGYASLSYLQSFPFDIIKIDQSFVKNLNSSSQSQIIVETVLAMAKKLNVKVTAEGVETVQQLRSLRQHKCPTAQGYLFSRPMPAEHVIPYLEAWTYPTDKSLLINNG